MEIWTMQLQLKKVKDIILLLDTFFFYSFMQVKALEVITVSGIIQSFQNTFDVSKSYFVVAV